MSSTMPQTGDSQRSHFDAIVVGAGFAGMYMLYRLREQGFVVRAFETADEVGGVWQWNRYPGARCDIESMQYSYSFSEELQQEWSWSERFAAQPEILRYARHVADRFNLRADIQFNTTVTGARFDEKRSLWHVQTDAGDQFTASFLIAASGCLSIPQLPPIEGFDTFKGKVLFTSKWPRAGVDLSRDCVGVIGTGSSGVQTITQLASGTEQLTVFQRTANYCVPSRNAPLDAATETHWKSNYAQLRQEMRLSRRGWITIGASHVGKGAPLTEQQRRKQLDARWESGGFAFLGAFDDILFNEEVNATASRFVAEKIEAAVDDKETAKSLTPNDHPLGTKRMVVDNGYYESYNRPNVKLVDLKSEKIERIEPDGVRTSKAFYPLDTIVLATGFDAMTGALLKMNVVGRGGQSLAQAWSAGPVNFLGLMVHGFPNLFVITGPGSPSVLSNMITAIEQHVEWIADCMVRLRADAVPTIEATADAQSGWVSHVNDVAQSMLYRVSNSWYLGSNMSGKPQVFMPYAGGSDVYRKKCEEVAATGYAGFRLGAARKETAQAELGVAQCL